MARTPERWDVEDNAFWDSTGKSIANRNLWVSIPEFALWFLGLAVLGHDHQDHATPAFRQSGAVTISRFAMMDNR